MSAAKSSGKPIDPIDLSRSIDEATAEPATGATPSPLVLSVADAPVADPILVNVTAAANLAAQLHGMEVNRHSGQPYVNRLVRLARTAASSGLSSDAVAAAYLHDALQLSAATPAMLEEAGLTFRTRQLVMLGTPKLMGQPLADPEACALWLLNQAERFDALHANIVTLGRRFALGVWIKAPIEAEPFIRVCRFPVAAQTWLDRFEALGRVIRPRDTPPLV